MLDGGRLARPQGAPEARTTPGTLLSDVRTPEPAHGPPRRVRRRGEEAHHPDRVLHTPGLAGRDEDLPRRGAEEGLHRRPARGSRARVAETDQRISPGEDRRDHGWSARPETAMILGRDSSSK